MLCRRLSHQDFFSLEEVLRILPCVRDNYAVLMCCHEMFVIYLRRAPEKIREKNFIYDIIKLFEICNANYYESCPKVSKEYLSASINALIIKFSYAEFIEDSITLLADIRGSLCQFYSVNSTVTKICLAIIVKNQKKDPINSSKLILDGLTFALITMPMYTSLDTAAELSIIFANIATRFKHYGIALGFLLVLEKNIDCMVADSLVMSLESLWTVFRLLLRLCLRLALKNPEKSIYYFEYCVEIICQIKHPLIDSFWKAELLSHILLSLCSLYQLLNNANEAKSYVSLQEHKLTSIRRLGANILGIINTLMGELKPPIEERNNLLLDRIRTSSDIFNVRNISLFLSFSHIKKLRR